MTYCYYSPGVGTVPSPNTLGMPSGLIAMSGEPRDMVIACDLGRAVVGIVGGVEAWRRAYPSTWPRAIDVFEGLLFVGVGTNVEVINPVTGFVHAVMSIPSAPAPISGLTLSREASDTWLAAAFDMNGYGSVRAYTLANMALTEGFRSTTHSMIHPRSAAVAGGFIYAADTFGHRVVEIEISSGTMTDFTNVFYPNHVQVVGGQVVIAAEHENRVFSRGFNPSGPRTMLMTAPVAPFNDITKTKTDIIAVEASTFDAASTFTPPKSLCAIEAAGTDTLYSPNSARLYGSDLLVADTDNHRTVVVRSGAVVTEVTNLNNPVTAVLI